MEERNRKLKSLLTPLKGSKAWAGAHGHNVLPKARQPRGAAAAQLCLQRQGSGASADLGDPSHRGSNLISGMSFFQEHWQRSSCCFKVWRFPQSSHPVGTCLVDPTVLGEDRRGGRASGSYWMFAGSISTLPMPKHTAFISVTSFGNWCPETFLIQVLLHFSPAFVFTPGHSLLRATFDLPTVLEVISFGGG